MVQPKSEPQCRMRLFKRKGRTNSCKNRLYVDIVVFEWRSVSGLGGPIALVGMVIGRDIGELSVAVPSTRDEASEVATGPSEIRSVTVAVVRDIKTMVAIRRNLPRDIGHDYLVKIGVNM